MTISGQRDRLIHILVVHYDMFREKAEEAADLFLHDQTLSLRSDAHTNGEVKALDVCVTGTNILSEYNISMRFAGEQFYESFSLGRHDAMTKAQVTFIQRLVGLYPGVTAVSLPSCPKCRQPCREDAVSICCDACAMCWPKTPDWDDRLSLGHPIQGDAIGNAWMEVWVSKLPKWRAEYLRDDCLVIKVDDIDAALLELDPQPPTPAGVREITEEAGKVKTWGEWERAQQESERK